MASGEMGRKPIDCVCAGKKVRVSRRRRKCFKKGTGWTCLPAYLFIIYIYIFLPFFLLVWSVIDAVFRPPRNAREKVLFFSVVGAQEIPKALRARLIFTWHFFLATYLERCPLYTPSLSLFIQYERLSVPYNNYFSCLFFRKTLLCRDVSLEKKSINLRPTRGTTAGRETSINIVIGGVTYFFSAPSI